MLTTHQISLVQDSFAKVAPIATTAADLFYTRLFELDPTLRRLFKDDLTEQKDKLMHTLAFAVGSLRRMDQLVPAVQALGKRHVGYQVQPQHYETVGTALLWALRQGLAADFTAEVEAAWTEVYGVLAITMKNA